MNSETYLEALVAALRERVEPPVSVECTEHSPNRYDEIEIDGMEDGSFIVIFLINDTVSARTYNANNANESEDEDDKEESYANGGVVVADTPHFYTDEFECPAADPDLVDKILDYAGLLTRK